MNLIHSFVRRLPRPLRDNVTLKLWGWNTPLINYLNPTVLSVDNKKIVLEIKLSNRANTHWKSMFAGALATGVDIAGGFLAFEKSTEKNIGIIYKDIRMDFLRRADGDVHFICENGDEINEGINKAYETRERINVPVIVKCYVPSSIDPCVIAHGTLSMKRFK